jgi:hypothetical protein
MERRLLFWCDRECGREWQGPAGSVARRVDTKRGLVRKEVSYDEASKSFKRCEVGSRGAPTCGLVGYAGCGVGGAV